MKVNNSLASEKKVCIGTATFGLRYGITNQEGKLSIKEIERILARSLESGIFQIDTAQAYGDAEKRLGQIGVKKFQVITKVSPPRNIHEFKKWNITQALEMSLGRLNLESCHGFLLHDTASLHNGRGAQIARQMHQVKSENKAFHIGFSTYDPMEAELLCERYEFDLVQLPYNILDRRAGECGAIARLNKKGIAVHVRSVFLQGLLLSEPMGGHQNSNLPIQLVQEFHQACQKYKVGPLRAALGYVLQEEAISSVVVGCASLKEWEEILIALKQPRVNLSWSPRAGFKKEMLDPRTWRKGSLSPACTQ